MKYVLYFRKLCNAIDSMLSVLETRGTVQETGFESSKLQPQLIPDVERDRLHTIRFVIEI